ncbi:S-adenosyl-L-methionine-dependent methyltransferase [Tricharina praecox]|uniref:S-adenosyl-L-methionine-dependent methyltransferase n=1 Tax=Tricharina praecox TaxID=43433 RepID=UPI0022209DD7|nr:S-adenosyl-L-methionine-dependent methyltransferase [Tricharina praecox]KAI5848851.1 S-adenosyl-L-methionine-dependent methyltransferase [Tricharina praecox]
MAGIENVTNTVPSFEDADSEYAWEYTRNGDYDEADDADDNCSLFSVETCSSASSISRSSNTANYRFENNRRYQSFREDWPLPNDEQEQDRMQILDQMLSLRLNQQLHLVPLEQPKRILDVGTGTGVWAIDMADKFPNARIIGTDLSPIQVAGPVNCTFEIEDANDEWLYPPNYFSLVHSRFLLGGINDWPTFFSEAYRTLHPGGWLELQDDPGKLYTDNASTPLSTLAITRATSCFSSFLTSQGRASGEELFTFDALMRAAGFVDVELTRHNIPLGAWSKESATEQEIGTLNMLSALEGVDAYIFACVDPGEAEALARQAKRDITNKKLELYTTFVVLKGRKPVGCETLPAVHP